MKRIAFSDFYTKLRPFRLDTFVDAYVDVQLIAVFKILSCELDDCFWDYDADGVENVHKFGYTKNGDKELIMLIFRHQNRVFTTVRPFRWRTYEYYRCAVGEMFQVVFA